MASKQQIKKEGWAKKCGRLLRDFLNAKTPEDAVRGLILNARKTLKIRCRVRPSLEEVRRLRHDSYLRGKWKEQKMLGDLVEELEKGVHPNESSILPSYTACYSLCCQDAVDALEDGSVGAIPFWNDGRIVKYDHILAYCVVTFLSVEENRFRLYKCSFPKCNNYKLGVQVKPPGENGFCSNTCRSKNR